MVNDIHKLETNKFSQDGSVTVTSGSHRAVEEGRANRFAYSFGVPNNSTKYFQIDIGDEDLYFLERIITIEGNTDIVDYTVIEDPTFTQGAVALPVMNSLRSNGDIDIYASIYEDPTGITGGVETDEIMIPTSTKNNGRFTNDDLLWVYKANSTLIVRIENTGNSAIDANLRYKWYVEN